MNDAREKSRQEGPVPNDDELVEAVRGGSLDAFSLLVLRYQDRLFSFLLQKLGSRQDAEDVAQATFVTAFQRLSQYQSRDRFAGWLFTIAHRRSISHHRGFFRRRRLAEAIEAEAGLEAPDPAEVAAARDDSLSIWRKAREVLSEPQHTGLWLHYAEGMSMEEIGEVLGKKTTSVKVMLHRARKTLAVHLERSEDREIPEISVMKSSAGPNSSPNPSQQNLLRPEIQL